LKTIIAIMSKDDFFTLVPASTSKHMWGKTSLVVDHQTVWKIFKKISDGQSLKNDETAVLFDFLLSIAIIVNKKYYPTERVSYNSKTGEYANLEQIDELMCAIEKTLVYYTKDAGNTVIKHYPEIPNTESLERRFYAHFRKKLSQTWIDCVRKDMNDPLRRRLEEITAGFTDDEDGLRRKQELAKEAGILHAGRADESTLETYAELEFSSEKMKRKYEEKVAELKTRLKPEFNRLYHLHLVGTRWEGVGNSDLIG
jgi:hypothetical protein